MRLIIFGYLYFGKILKNMEEKLFFLTAMAGLGKYTAGVYGQIGSKGLKIL